PLQNVGKSLEDPEVFMKYWLDVDLWDKQAEILRAIVDKPRVVVKACHASGKCVAASEWLTLVDGSRVKAGDLVGKTFYLPTLDEKGNVVSALAKAEINATEEVFTVTTESGRKIVRNSQHPIWSAYRAKKGNGV